MPYIPSEDRPTLDQRVDKLADEISSRLIEMNKTAHISVLYEESMATIVETLYSLEIGKSAGEAKTPSEDLAHEIFKISRKHGYDCPWLGELNYSLTRLIQLVPRKMVEKGKWKDEFRYWIFAQTCGALEKVALRMHAHLTTPGHAYILNGMIGALFDIKDEYKRRVNSAYEAVQIRKSGDCYDGPYRTELEDIKDNGGEVVGYREIMKDFRDSTAKPSPQEKHEE